MSSLGGRWPKKLYILFVREETFPEEDVLDVLTDGEVSIAPGTPSPDMIDTVLARFICLFAAGFVPLSRRSSACLPKRGTP